MNSIFFFYPESFLYEQTINLALKNICDEFHLIYKPCTYKSGFKSQLRELPIDKSCTIACFENNPDFSMKDYDVVKERFPNAKLVMFGSDTVYYGGANAIAWHIDLLIDTLTCVVRHSPRFPAEHMFWSVSETILEDIENTPLNHHKDKALISLCKTGSSERSRFFNDLAASAMKVHWNMNMWELKEIYQYTASCKYALGHTTPVHDGKVRSMKGFRDWISPHCGTVLIYDDHEDIRLLIPNEVLPTYRYLDSGEVIRLTQLIDNTPGMYEEYLVKQKKWAWDNSLEKQIKRIFLKYDLIREL